MESASNSCFRFLAHQKRDSDKDHQMSKERHLLSQSFAQTRDGPCEAQSEGPRKKRVRRVSEKYGLFVIHAKLSLLSLLRTSRHLSPIKGESSQIVTIDRPLLRVINQLAIGTPRYQNSTDLALMNRAVERIV